MKLEELKLLNDAELQEVHQKAIGFMKGITKNGDRPNQEDFLKNMQIAIDAGQILRERGIIKEEPKKQETEEERDERISNFKRKSRNEDIGYIIKGVVILCIGLFLSAIMEGRFLFYGAILMGIGFIGIGLYSLIKNG